MAGLLLVPATLADLALAAVPIGVSGVLFGSGPEGMHGGMLASAAYAAGVIACLATPAAGFILKGLGKPGFGQLVARLPAVSALIALAVPAHYSECSDRRGYWPPGPQARHATSRSGAAPYR